MPKRSYEYSMRTMAFHIHGARGIMTKHEMVWTTPIQDWVGEQYSAFQSSCLLAAKAIGLATIIKERIPQLNFHLRNYNFLDNKYREPSEC